MPNFFVATKHGNSHVVMSASEMRNEADARAKIASTGLVPVSVHRTHAEAVTAVEVLNGTQAEVQPAEHPPA
jgi:hypothetical protein